MELDKLFCITEKDWHKVISWAKIAYDEDKNEISGLATAVPNKDGIYTVGDIEILKQENTGANTELDGDAVADYKMRYAMKYKNPGIKFVWWHSHHTMGAFWSGTDVKEIEAWKNESFSLALVVNLKQEYKFRVSVWKASGLEIEQHYDTTLNIIRKDGLSITKEMKKQYKELCSDKASNYVHNWNNHVQNTFWTNNQLPSVQDKFVLKDKTFYNQIVEAIETIVDDFMSGNYSTSKFTKKLKSLQSMMNKQEITEYKIIIPKGNKEQLIDTLSTSFPSDLLKFKDKITQNEYEIGEMNGWYN